MLKLPAAPTPPLVPCVIHENKITSVHAAEVWLRWSRQLEVTLEDIVEYDRDLPTFTRVAHAMAADVPGSRRVTLYNCRARLQRSRASLIDGIITSLVKITADTTIQLRPIRPQLMGELLTYGWSARAFVVGTWLYAISPPAATDTARCIRAAHALTNEQRHIIYDSIIELI